MHAMSARQSVPRRRAILPVIELLYEPRSYEQKPTHCLGIPQKPVVLHIPRM